jgi:hypothetical protein
MRPTYTHEAGGLSPNPISLVWSVQIEMSATLGPDFLPVGAVQCMIRVIMAHDYDIIEHVHRFAAWAASRAASSARGYKFKVRDGQKIIEAAGLRDLIGGPKTLPKPEAMDAAHKEWRKLAKEAAKQRGLVFTDGVAAKLINIYLKAGLVTVANRDDARVGALHPPVDRVLLCRLAKDDKEENPERAKFWRKKSRVGWSKFNSKQYEEVIDMIRQKLGDKGPLWAIEEHFPGYRHYGKDI